MEITNEIKAKVFAQYLRQRLAIGIGGTKDDCFLHGIKENTSIYTGINSVGVDSWYKISACKLILKPLSAITDEDLQTLSEMMSGTNLPISPEYIKRLIERGRTYDWGLRFWQFLQSRGYDLPQYLLNGKTLQEAGLAVYE